MGVQGISGDDDTGEIDPIQQWRESGDLIALVIDLGLAQGRERLLHERKLAATLQ